MKLNIMCVRVVYRFNGHEMQTDFANPQAWLPVLTRKGVVTLLPWGRRSQQVGQLPLGGWADLSQIKAGLWDAYFPKPVRLPIVSFTELDIENKPREYSLTAGQWIQGLVASLEAERRVYIVTIQPYGLYAHHSRWPRVVSG